MSNALNMRWVTSDVMVDTVTSDGQRGLLPCRDRSLGWHQHRVYVCDERNTHTHLCIITEQREQPHRLSSNWSRRAASLKYVVTKRAVENMVGGEHMQQTDTHRPQHAGSHTLT